MPKDAKAKALADAKRAQLDYERDVKAAREARRKSFARAQKAGSSLADIGEVVGLHRSQRSAATPFYTGSIPVAHRPLASGLPLARGV